ncbi:MAG: poly-gamma-glutamate synthase PgsB [Clostridiaceae bacterium]|nr:poly-gamma-glutamate synthase PgsB [Clostridiaceae bacterium]
MELIILSSGVLYIVFLIYEYYSLSAMRKGFRHIIHVNGIRGKSTVCRLIDAGLRAGGHKVFTKTTGTSPRMLYADGSEHELIRRGRANIKEQIGIIRKARAQGAEILVIECMAVKPELQELCQEKLLAADIGVITNVRPDHLDEMGDSLEEIAEALSLTIPRKGALFTGDSRYLGFFKKSAEAKGSEAFYAEEVKEDLSEIDFMDNVSLALAVCRYLGVERDTAIDGMREYKRDPGSLKIYRKRNRAGSILTFVNALAANDPESTRLIMDNVFLKLVQTGEKRVLLINNRKDRLGRMLQFCDFTLQSRENFDSIWLCGHLRQLMAGMLVRSGIPPGLIRHIRSIRDLEDTSEDAAVLAVGNIAGFGRTLTDYMEKTGDILGG